MNIKKLKRRRNTLLFKGVVAAIIICLIIVAILMNKTIQIRSDSAMVEFVTEGDFVTDVNIHGQFPYRYIVPALDKSVVRDSAGNVVQEIRTYTLGAELSWNMQTDMKIDIETADDIVYIYNLKFADKDISIVDGKVVE